MRLELDRVDVEATLQPVERASMLPPAAFIDPAILAWELRNIYRRRLDLRRPRLRGRRAGLLHHPRGGGGQRPRHRRRGRAAARLPQRLPPPRLPHPRGRGEGSVRKRLRCPYHAWSYDLDGNAARRSSHGRSRGLRPLLLRPARGAQRDRSAASCWSTWAARRGPSRTTSASCSPHLERYRVDGLRRGGLLTYEVDGELEGHRRELQRVPALPRRASGAERAQRLHERRGLLRRRRLVRRLDDPRRGAPRRWAATAATPAPARRSPASTTPTCATSSTWRSSPTRSSRSTLTT